MATILRVSNKDGSVSFQAQVRIQRAGKILLNESRNFKVSGAGTRAEAVAKRLAEDWAARLTEQMQDATAINQHKLKSVTLQSLIGQYIEFIEKDKPIGDTKRSVLNILARSTLLGDLPLSRLTTDIIVEYARERGSGGTLPQTINQDIIYLGGVLKTANKYFGMNIDISIFELASEYLHANGMIGKSAERDRRLGESELSRLMAVARPTNHQRVIPITDVMRFAVETAMRLGEIVALRWSDLDEKNRTIMIRDRKDPKKKIGNNQMVPLLGFAMDIIQSQPRAHECIFPYKAECASAAFTRLCSRAGIIDLHFHDLRHEGISRLFEQGYAIQEVALVSGHRSWKNLARYTQLRAVDLHRDKPRVITELSDRVDRR
ncbi:site-specific integrase [Iodobacter fluviatilis]|uniref:Site-specific integrase n=1 Tax=Iodobacter fluviatilis TaxID=537 RepID=A0A7G3GAX0_9NEIS|nr:site-specific integrase [Iodobacter fluviatilis]QBC44421.1 site-specific integrase [Iodobacter fluviatilis]